MIRGEEPSTRRRDLTTTTQPAHPVRSSGILLHPTSLPGPYGIGDLGPAAYAWVDQLVRAGQTWWQVLPLSPPDFANSPYQSASTFAGNTNLISPDLLVQDGLLKKNDLSHADFPADRVEDKAVTEFKHGLLRRAWDVFRSGAVPALLTEFAEFGAREAAWLPDFALFMALKNAFKGGSWHQWPADLVERMPTAMVQARRELAGEIDFQQFSQFLFFRQWFALKQYAKQNQVRLIGDLPIYVAADSADVWANPKFFLLDAHRRPTFVGGVPPDYFAKTGQLWGSPLYDWEALHAAGYSWWIARLRHVLQQVDLVRLDHFRGFEAFWQIPADHPTAEHGSWVKGPGADLLRALRDAIGELPLIAEDLGVITPGVDALRHKFELPGMKVLQFAFGGAQEDRFLPHNYEQNTVVYTGTHDNDTAVGWFATLTAVEQKFLNGYLPGAELDPAAALVRIAWASVGDLAIAPLQDVLGLGPEARMNMPGTAVGNWRWRLRAELLTDDVIAGLRELTKVYQRGESKQVEKNHPQISQITQKTVV